MDHVFRCSGYDLIKPDIVRAEGCYLYDKSGKKYTDFESGVWCTVLGHASPRINDILRQQSARISHAGYRYSTKVVETAAKLVLETLDLSDGQCLFLSSGSEAVESAVKMARRLTGKPLLLRLSEAYLAAYGSAGHRKESEWCCFDWEICHRCIKNKTCDPGCFHMADIPFHKTGGFVFEPGNTSGLVKFPPESLVKTLAERIKQQGGLLIVDEVTTGMGRTGKWFGYQHYHLQPDIVALGKGLGNGYPVSAVAMRGDVAQSLMESGFQYAQSHQNDPLACAVAAEVVRRVGQDQLVEKSESMGRYFLQQLQQLQSRCRTITDVRGRGLMIAVEIDIDENRLRTVFLNLVERGILVGFKPAAGIFRFYPPLVIREADVDELLENLENELLEN